MRLALTICSLTLAFSAIAAEPEPRSFSINARLPSTTPGMVMTDITGGAASPEVPAATAVPAPVAEASSGLPPIPAATPATSASPGVPSPGASAPDTPAPVEGTPAKVYPTLAAANADGINPLAPKASASTALKRSPLDEAMAFVVEHIRELGLGALLLVLLGLAVSLRRRSKKSSEQE